MSALALVTGASFDIEKALAPAFDDGFDLIVVGRRRDRLEDSQHHFRR